MRFSTTTAAGKQGYVSHVLSQHYGYRVMAVEGNEDYSDKGVARVKSISTRIRKRVVEAGMSVKICGA
jgi:hypothetical protein